MKVDANVIVKLHIHDEQPNTEDTTEDKEILAKFQKSSDEYKRRFGIYVDGLVKERFNDEIADGYFKVDTEVESFTIEE